MRHAFALIYVLVITVIIMITITSILTLGLSDIRQKNKVLATTGAWQMAQSGIEDGIANYRIDWLKGNPVDCVSHFYKVSATSNNYSTGIRPDFDSLATDQGLYEFKLCNADYNDYISAVGYFKGSKVALRADYLSAETEYFKWNIYQVGF